MWIVTICTYISYVPQIVKLIKTKKSEDLSITSWILWCISSVANLVYSIILGRYELIIASVSEFLLISIVLFLSIYYNYKNNYYVEPEKEFQDRVNRISSKDGNHMALITAMIEDRQRKIENRSKHKIHFWD
jgi:MtN3 and saliva related transmembrane protein